MKHGGFDKFKNEEGDDEGDIITPDERDALNLLLTSMGVVDKKGDRVDERAKRFTEEEVREREIKEPHISSFLIKEEKRADNREVVSECVIEEGRIPKREDVIDLVRGIAKVEGVTPQQLTITKEIYDSQERLVYLRMEIDGGAAREKGWGRCIYGYMVKGKHPGVGHAHRTMITRAISREDDPDTFTSGGVVAKYSGREWNIAPGEWSPNARDVDDDAGEEWKG